MGKWDGESGKGLGLMMMVVVEEKETVVVMTAEEHGGKQWEGSVVSK